MKNTGEKSTKGISTNDNWGVFQFALVLYMASAWFSSLIIQVFASQLDVQYFAISGAVTCMGYAMSKLLPVVSVS